MTDAEAAEVSGLLDRADQAIAMEKQLKKLDGGVHSVRGIGGEYGGPGDIFVKSAAYQRISDPGARGQQWSTGAVDVSSKAGTLLESGQGSGLVPVPQAVPGVVETLFQPLSVIDLFPSVQATNPVIRYIVEGTATSGAAGVAEGGAKPESDFAYSTVDEPVKKIATAIVVSDELLDDSSNVQQFLNQRLSLFVKLEEERQLLRGGGTNELVGVIGRSGVNTYSRGTVDNNAVALGKVLANTRGSSNLDPSGIIMHPSNWLATRLLTDTAGQFFGAGPFGNSYGNSQSPGLFGASLWGVPVALSTTVGAGTAVVGSFAEATAVYRKGGLTVEATNSHASLFLSNEVAIRAEQREALAVFRPGALTVVSGLA
jgi:HK97 family phage major capsid protein